MDVYFDDFKVSHTFSDVVFASDYYPFGLAMEDRKIEREQYRFGYQGQFAEKDEETGWNAFELRMYNSRIGRWMAVDPYRQFASPYVGMGNNPVMRVDPDGGNDDWYRNDKTGALEFFEFESGYLEGYTWIASNDAPLDQIRNAYSFLQDDISSLMYEVVVTPSFYSKSLDFLKEAPRDALNSFLYVSSAVGMPLANQFSILYNRNILNDYTYSHYESLPWAGVYTFDKDYNLVKRGLNDTPDLVETFHYSTNVLLTPISGQLVGN